MDKYNAVIDMGSNSVRLVIYYEAEDGTMYEVDNMKSTIRLSSFLDSNNNITEEGIERTLHALIQFRQLCDGRRISHVTGVATAAVRKAVNRDILLQRIVETTGFRFRVLSGEEEAYYGYLAVVNTMRVHDCITLDIGGGSTEVVKISGRKLVKSHSFPFGAVTLTDQFFQSEVPTEEEIERLEQFLRTAFASKPWLREKKYSLVGMGGTARNLGKIHQKRTRYPFASVHYYEMRKYEVASVFDSMKNLTPVQMQAVEGLSKERADIIVAGMLIIKVLLEFSRSERFIVSNKGLRDGVYIESRLRKVGKPVIEDVVGYGVRDLMNQYKVNKSHAYHVEELCRDMFEQLRRENLHPHGENEKELLAAAALLHDIGRMISFRDAHQHTFYLLVHVLLPGLTHKQRLLTALLASYKGTKKMQQLVAPYESMVTEADLQMVEQLGLLLLMARALDRTESRQISRISFVRSGDSLILKCCGEDKLPLEMKTIEEHRKKFKKHYGIPLHIQWIYQS
ncbi:exopolyphosphatase [Aneurinibacillus tyrosinisolvens]|uniref:exopolyphosphatase n=1 Tax=Aneurinibacillus tyrosinisolvens TaxID=1443435 RepID=UPI00069CADAB|nr:exopolyphosphatase [Aneurinibacillus tyrosinisolvens]